MHTCFAKHFESYRQKEHLSAMEDHGTSLPWKVSLLYSLYPLVQPLHPREPCELHFQAGVATAAAGDCATALMNERKRHAGQFLENKPCLELWWLCSNDKDAEQSLQEGFLSWLFFTWHYELGLHMHSLKQKESPVYKALAKVFKTSGVSRAGIKLFCTFGMQNHFGFVCNESKLLISLLLLPLCSVTADLGFPMTLCPRD